MIESFKKTPQIVRIPKKVEISGCLTLVAMGLNIQQGCAILSKSSNNFG